MAQTFMREDWQPKPEHAEHVRASGLDLDAVVADFRNHWLGEGKSRADWNATFRQNVDRIKRTDWLVARFKAPEREPELPILRLPNREALIPKHEDAPDFSGVSFGARA